VTCGGKAKKGEKKIRAQLQQSDTHRRDWFARYLFDKRQELCYLFFYKKNDK
jgi:hypothetical protein